MFGMEYRIDEYKDLVASGHYDVNAQDADGKTPLHYATEQGVVEVIRSLLDAGADPNIPEFLHGNTPLNNAVFHVNTCGVEVVETMLACGGDPTIANHHGNSALSLAEDGGSRDRGPVWARLGPMLEEAAKAHKGDDWRSDQHGQ